MKPGVVTGAARGLALAWMLVSSVTAAAPSWQQGLHAERLSAGVALALEDSRIATTSRRAAPSAIPVPAVLDPRVGPNVGLGSDPAILPAGFRAQAEPHVARHPVDPDLLLATFQDGRFTDGGAVTCGYAISRDGGLSWSRGIIPKATKLDGGKPDRATDPVAGFSPGGKTFYLNTLGIEGANLEIGILQISRSTDGGVTFLPPVEIYRSPDGSVFPDKNWMVVNPFPGTPTHGRVVVTFTRFQGAASPIAVTYSDDDGVTWRTPFLVTPANAQCQGSQPVFLPDGKLAVVYWDFLGSGSFDHSLRVVVSPDGGSTFGPPSTAVSGIIFHDDPTLRDGGFLPTAVADFSSGTIWVSYQASVGGVPRILVARSTDGAKTWSLPVVASDNPKTASVFNPVLAASADGRSVIVAFWDKRASADAYHVDTWVAQSMDGGTTWQPNLRVTSVSTDARLAPNTARGYMIGDYFGLAAPVDVLTPAVVVTIDTRDGEPQPLSSRFGVGPGLTFDNWRAARFSRAFVADPTKGGENGDADGDGTGLFAEYAFGTDPSLPDRPAVRIGRTAQGPVTISYPFNAAATDVLVDLETSVDLVDWSPVPGSTAAGEGPVATIPRERSGLGAHYRARATRK